jgi:hypothetical protein
MGGGFAGAGIGRGFAGRQAGRQTGSAGGFAANRGVRIGPRRAYGWRNPGAYYDYGYDDSCLNYPPYYRRSPWNCYW